MSDVATARRPLRPPTGILALVPRLFTIAAVVFGLLGIGIAGWGVFFLEAADASSDWPVVEGQVVESVLVSHPGVRIPGERAGAPRLGGRVPRIRYTYMVDGRHYESLRISLGGGIKDGQPPLERYPKGSRVKVYYDPGDPSRAILEPGVGPRAWVPLGIGAFFVLFSGVLWLLMRYVFFPPDAERV